MPFPKQTNASAKACRSLPHCSLRHLCALVYWNRRPETQWAKQIRVNSSSKRLRYSAIFLARLLIAQPHFRLPDKNQINALGQIKTYMESVLCKWILWGYLRVKAEWHLLKPEIYVNVGAWFIAPGFRYLNGRDKSRPYIPVVGQLLRLTQVFILK